MRELEERIVRDGIVKAGNVLKVDAFLNHQCDVELFDHMGAEWARLFEGAGTVSYTHLTLPTICSV